MRPCCFRPCFVSLCAVDRFQAIVVVPVFWTRGRPKHQAALRLSFSRTRAGVRYPVPLEKPPAVVEFDEGPDHLSGLLEGFEVVQMDALLLERTDEALGDAVALRLGPRRPASSGCRAI